MDSVSAFRQEFRSTKISRFYSGVVHFCFTFGIGLAVMIRSAFLIRNLMGLELLVVPLTFLYANFAEYLFHRGPMHRSTPLLSLIYRRHTLEHHRFFTHNSMFLELTNDLKMVLFPPLLIVAIFGIFALPVGFIIFKLVTPNSAYLFVITTMGYFLNYELFHLAYHLSDKSGMGKNPMIRKLRRHHTLHHDVHFMARHNFNITYPLCDWIFGTLYPDFK